jgi:hypothetical protein
MVPVFKWNHKTLPESEWLPLGKGAPVAFGVSRRTVYNWVRTGAPIPGMPPNIRLPLPTFSRNGRRYTTMVAYHWWLKQQEGR